MTRGAEADTRVDVSRQHRSRSARMSRKLSLDAALTIPRHRLDGAIAPVALVVDDEPMVRRFVAAVLQREGWTVREAADALAALEMASVEPPDLLITDYEMPSVTGIALAEQLRQFDKDLPVLVVSGRPDVARSMRNLHGRTAFASKPFEIEELVSTIGSIVS
jgi:two-component system, OmpR family, KDP operon response regulator KdpE